MDPKSQLRAGIIRTLHLKAETEIETVDRLMSLFASWQREPASAEIAGTVNGLAAGVVHADGMTVDRITGRGADLDPFSRQPKALAAVDDSEGASGIAMGAEYQFPNAGERTLRLMALENFNEAVDLQAEIDAKKAMRDNKLARFHELEDAADDHARLVVAPRLREVTARDIAEGAHHDNSYAGEV